MRVWKENETSVSISVLYGCCRVQFHPMKVDDQVAIFQNIQSDKAINIAHIVMEDAEINTNVFHGQIAKLNLIDFFSE